MNRPSENKAKSDRQLMLFDLSVKGHHPIYIQHLIQYWHKNSLSGQLNVVVSRRFFQEHRNVVDWAETHSPSQVKFVGISPEEEAALNSRKSKIKRSLRNFQEWEIFCKYAEKLAASHALIMYFDTCEFPLALGRRSPCPFSGIYFRPTFHYPQELTNYSPTQQERWQQWREKLLLSRILRHPKLQNLFCLDPFAIDHLNRFKTHVKAIHLPDPVEQIEPEKLPSSLLKEQLGIDPERQIFLLFGALTQRKGIYQLLDAIASLSPELNQKICLLLVGESNIATSLDLKIARLCQEQPVQIIRRYEFISDEEIPAYFNLADVVLAPYQRHVGMSGILLLAAAAAKPVLSSNYGLMGEMVKRHQLGLTVDSTIPSEIAQGLIRFLQDDSEKLGDHSKMRSFAQENSAQAFAELIFKHLNI
ncbi:MAG: glycosyltransferase [Lyngbya sp.]|nr:glycosyltransferase [Lyngbya sp.]